MYIYFALFCLISLSALTHQFTNSYQKKILFCFLSLILIFVCGLRGAVGRDYNIYIQAYYLPSFHLVDYFLGDATFTNEPMVNIIASICKFQFNSITAFFLVFAVLTQIHYIQ